MNEVPNLACSLSESNPPNIFLVLPKEATDELEHREAESEIVFEEEIGGWSRCLIGMDVDRPAMDVEGVLEERRCNPSP